MRRSSGAAARERQAPKRHLTHASCLDQGSELSHWRDDIQEHTKSSMPL
jgi:hypothetical protein